MEIIVQIGRLGLNSPKIAAAHVIVISRGVESRTGNTYGNVDEGKAVRVAAFPPRSEEQLERESVYTEILFAPERYDAQARNGIGELGAFCQQWPSEREIQASVDRARKHLEAGKPAADVRRLSVAAEGVNYTARELKAAKALLHRASHLEKRTQGREDLTYDRQELSALGWVLAELVKARGTMPEELEAIRADLFAPKAAV